LAEFGLVLPQKPVVLRQALPDILEDASNELGGLARMALLLITRMQEYRLLRKKTKTRKQLLTMWEVPVKEEPKAEDTNSAECRVGLSRAAQARSQNNNDLKSVFPRMVARVLGELHSDVSVL
jgi:hypothetical protein